MEERSRCEDVGKKDRIQGVIESTESNVGKTKGDSYYGSLTRILSSDFHA